VRRRAGGTTTTEQGSAPAEGAAGPATEDTSDDGRSTHEWDAPVAAVADVGATEETPEWEPHPAARPAEEDAADVGDSIEQAPIAGGIEEKELWTEPTPTAMTEASVFDEPDLTDPEAGGDARSVVVAEETTTPDDSFSSFSTPQGAEEPVSEVGALEEVSAGVAAELGIPEEEPFERAGRWWFKRGSELLVYNEQTGEWMPSPTPLPESPAGGGFTQPEGSTEVGIGLAPDDSVKEEPADKGPAELQPAQGGFWRCVACGAVNGSTSTSCRMCFAERPAG
jgi:hypothetical protein